MIRKLKWKTGAACALLLLSSAGAGAAASAEQVTAEVDVYYAPMHFVVDDSEYSPPEGQQGFIYEGSTYVPLRFISYTLNKGVRWDGNTYTVSIEKPTAMENTEIQDYNLNRKVRTPSSHAVKPDGLKTTSIQVYKENITYLFDGQKKQPADDLPGFIYEDTLYVPMRFVSESLGKKIVWDPKTYSVIAEKADVPADKTQPAADPSETPNIPVIGGFGGGVPASNASYQSIVSTADTQISSLRSSCESGLRNLADQYYLTKDKQLLVQGYAIVARCDSEFNAILQSLQTQLQASGYSTEIVDQYRAEYEAEKAAEMTKIQNRLAQ